MKRCVVLLMVCTLLLPPLHAGAQDGGGCSEQTIDMGLALANALYDRIGAALAAGDLETAQLEAATLTEHLANLYDTCGDIASDGAAGDLCTQFPLYCVPNVESQGVDGVVRGFDAEGFPFIGDPDAPIHFRIVSAPGCSHCWLFFLNDVRDFIESDVLNGRATVGYVLLTTIGDHAGSYTGTVNAICAGQQGRFWEYLDAMWSVTDERGPDAGLTGDAFTQRAQELGLDMAQLDVCMQSTQTAERVESYRQFSIDHGVVGTPTLLVSYGDSGTWERLDSGARNYHTMVTMTQAAN